MAGHAIADVVTGRFNPIGRLPVTWPRDVGQIPIHFSARSSGRPMEAGNPYTSKYLDLPNEPLFFFGHGLSYAHVALANLRACRTDFNLGEVVEIAVEASNRGGIATEETVFLFMRDIVASVARPLMELKSWEKVALAAGETKTLRFTLAAESFEFLGEDFEPVTEPGEFEILVGLNADPKAALKTRISLRPGANAGV